MPEPAFAVFDTLAAAQKLKAAGFDAERADTIVEVMGQSANQLVTRERFDAGIDAVQTGLGARIDAVQTELLVTRERFDAGIDAVQTELLVTREHFDARIEGGEAKLVAHISSVETRMMRVILFAVGLPISAMALMITVAGVLLSRGSG